MEAGAKATQRAELQPALNPDISKVGSESRRGHANLEGRTEAKADVSKLGL
ncbi:unnamed protein product [Toxocara canis]|uniref:Uncharacterized protein n=1 Tax=Toxocara canis TaxID=6265 RepID=A0A3P7GD86_TOXCA|nr:unnamed protein product [Toxocara canis]